MNDDLIAIRDVAASHGKRKQHIFKVLKRIGIETTKQRCSTGGNQLASYITSDEYQRLRIELSTISDAEDSDHQNLGIAETGVFYLVQLEPTLDPLRFKLGFATSLSERLRHARCFAPFATVVRSWPCRRLWEKTAIEGVSVGCERLHTEVFRARCLDEVVERCEQFFRIMPPIEADQSAEVPETGIVPVEIRPKSAMAE